MGSVRVAQSHSNVRPAEDRGKCESVRSAVSHPSSCCMTQVMEAEILNPCIALRQVKSTLYVSQNFQVRSTYSSTIQVADLM